MRFDSDMDHATWQNGPEAIEREPGEPSDAELESDLMDEAYRLLSLMNERRLEHSAHRCAHGVNLERAGCGQCLRDELATQYAARFVAVLNKIEGGENE